MEIDEIIYEEVMNQLEQEIIEQFGEDIQDEIEALMDDFEVDVEGSLLSGLIEHPLLSKLNYSILGMEMLVSLSPDFVDKDNLEIIEDVLRDKPDNRFFSFIWVIYKVCQYKLNGATNEQVADLLKKLFSDYGELVLIDGFIDGLELRQLREPGDWNQEVFAPVFEKAAVDFEKKHAIRAMLAEIYWFNKDFKQAISTYTKLVNNIDFTHVEDYLDDDFTLIDYYKVVQNRGVLYQISGDTTKALNDADFVIENAPVEAAEDFLPAFFTRMRINIDANNKVAILKDYRKIKKTEFTIEAYLNNFSDVLSYIDRNKSLLEASA